MALEYDVSFVRHESEVIVPLMRMLNMEPNQRALVRLETGQGMENVERLDGYLKRTMCLLGNNVRNYSFIIGIRNNKYGLVVERKQK